MCIRDRSYPIATLITSYVDGAYLAPRAGSHHLPVINPATESVIAQLQEADGAEVDLAVRAAARSYAEGTWRRLPTERRAAILRRVCDLTEQHARELCWLESTDLGIPSSQAPGAVIARVVRNFSFYADHLSQGAERAVKLDDRYQRFVHRDPVGVCALISPWNAPLMLATSKIAPALAFGNSCVIKTSEYTPLALHRFMALLSEAGVPPGVVNLVNGRGEVTGASLVAHEAVGLVSFTGGGAAGRRIAAVAGAGLKKCDLELGGKSASIISDSADLDLAVDGALLGIFGNAGQMCFAGSRILLQRRIADAFLERFVARANAIRVGDPFDLATEMGPLAYASHLDRVLAHCRPTVGDGVSVLAGGERTAGGGLDHLDDGDAVLAGVAFAGVAEHRCGGGVAGDDEHFHAGVDEFIHDAKRVGAYFCDFEGAVGAVGGVADVDDAFVRQLVHDGACHGESANAGVEDADGCRGGGAYGRGASPGGAGTVGICCVDAVTHVSPTLRYRSGTTFYANSLRLPF